MIMETDICADAVHRCFYTVLCIAAPDATRTQRFLTQISMDTATVIFCGTLFKNINPTYYK